MAVTLLGRGRRRGSAPVPPPLGENIVKSAAGHPMYMLGNRLQHHWMGQTFTADQDSWANGTPMQGFSDGGGVLLSGESIIEAIIEDDGILALAWQVAHIGADVVQSRVLVNGTEVASDLIDNPSWPGTIPPSENSISIVQNVPVAKWDRVVVELSTRAAGSLQPTTPPPEVAPILRWTAFSQPTPAPTNRIVDWLWLGGGKIKPADWDAHLTTPGGYMTIDGDWNGDYQFVANPANSSKDDYFVGITTDAATSNGHYCVGPQGSVPGWTLIQNGPPLQIGCTGTNTTWPWPFMNPDGTLRYDTPSVQSVLNEDTHVLQYMQGGDHDDESVKNLAYARRTDPRDLRFTPMLVTKVTEFLVTLTGNWHIDGRKLLHEEYTSQKPPGWQDGQAIQSTAIYADRHGLLFSFAGCTVPRATATVWDHADLYWLIGGEGSGQGQNRQPDVDIRNQTYHVKFRRRPDWQGNESLTQIELNGQLVFDDNRTNSVDSAPASGFIGDAAAKTESIGNYLFNPQGTTATYHWKRRYVET